MNSEEIRKVQELKIKATPEIADHFLSRAFWLSEIAAQLAEQNERAARQEPTALRIAEKSLAMMERTEKACAELEEKTRGTS